ncbi:hypothetical protein CROQUDRAFT_100083 [Cronartium quercuum f. sp. fusiforme G11]|uniref:Uncharacterized protein n=1 Tax=Cronartium quercuum f. sp. fusiforme G11 TaxID=708437 RepID=A0A9P6NB04_9BASI|nr:hypothetical protein CROQUDRAFT_100083 [Cronartium quercuum f. sp. fusiforme G11]
MATGLPDKIENVPFSCADCLLSKSVHMQMLGPLGGEWPQPLKLLIADIAGPFNAGMAGICPEAADGLCYLPGEHEQ